MNLVDIIIQAGRVKTEVEANEAIASMLRPSDRTQMSDVYTTVMGYNPITYFTENEIREKISSIMKESASLREYFTNVEITEDAIANMAMKIHESHRDRTQLLTIQEAMYSMCPDCPEEILQEIQDIPVPKDEYEIDSTFDDEDDDDEDFEGEEDEEEEDDED